MVLNHKTRIHIDEKMKSELADRLPEPIRTVFLEDPNDMDFEIFLDRLGLYEKMAKKLQNTREKAASPSGLPMNLLLIASSAVVALSMLINSNYTLPFILITIKWILIPLALVSFSFALSYGITKHCTPWSLARITSKKFGLELSTEGLKLELEEK